MLNHECHLFTYSTSAFAGSNEFLEKDCIIWILFYVSFWIDELIEFLKEYIEFFCVFLHADKSVTSMENRTEEAIKECRI